MKSILIPTTLIGKLGTMIIAILMLLLLLTLNACSTSNEALDNSNNNLSSALSFENASTVPVLDGQATRTGVYIRNNTSRVIQDIKYQLDDGESTIKPGITLNGYQCNRIEANSSCLLGFTTKSLKIGEAGSAMIVAHYTVGGSQPLKSKQLINLHYADTHSCSGIQFGGEVSLFHQGDYATAYAYTCGGKSFNDVGFYALEKSVAVVGDINNGRINMLAQQVLPLEITTGQRVTANNVTVVPFLSHEIGFANMKNDYELRAVLKQQATSKSLLGAGLLGVVITPNTQANLVMSDLSLMTDSTTDQTITVFNNGNRTATSMNMSLPAALTQQSTTCGTTLAANASCNYVVRLSSSTLGNGNVTVTLNYNNGSTATSASQIAYYSINTTEAMVYITANPTSITMNTNESTTVSFTLYNTGGQAVAASPTITLSQNGLTNTLTTSANTCTGGIAVGSSCTITGKVAAGSGFGTGKTFLKVLATSQTSGNTFSFVSPSIATTVNNPNPAITSVTPADGSTNVNTATSIQLNFNVPMNPLKLNVANIQLFRVSDNQQITLNPGTVSPDNQTVTFTLDSPLTSFINYKIVVNQVNVISAAGAALGSNTAYTVATFTTGDWSAPTLTSYQPFTGSILQSRNSTVRLTFSESMDVTNLMAAGTVRLINASNGSEVTLNNPQWVVDSSGYSYYVNHVTFESLTSYQLVINQTKVRDSSMNNVPMGSNESYTVSSFSTAAFLNPTISSVSPAINGVGVSTSESLSITFSSTMNTSTLTNTNIKLKRLYDGANVTLTNPSYNYINNMVTFTISGGMLANTTYQVQFVESQIKDQVNDLPLDISGFNNNSNIYQFTTGGFNSTGFVLVGSGSTFGTQFYGESVIDYSYAGTQTFKYLTYTAATTYLAFSSTGNILYRSFNGNDWTPQTLPSSILTYASSVNSLYCSSVVSNCFLVGTSGKIFRSTDAGYNWSSVTSNTTYELNTIACDNSTGQYCVAGGGDNTTGVIVYSTDYGQTWTQVTSTSWLAINSVAFVGNSSRVIMGGRGLFATGKIALYYNTANGVGDNTTWTATDSKFTSGQYIAEVGCLSNSTCVATGNSSNKAAVTTNADSTSSWTASSASFASNLILGQEGLYCNSSKCFIAMYDNTNTKSVVYSISSTSNLTQVVTNISQFVNGGSSGNVRAISGDRNNSMIALSSGGAAIQTTNAFSGGSYTQVRSATSVPANNDASVGAAISCFSSKCIFARYNSSSSATTGVYYSSDYGVTWTKSASTAATLTSYVQSVIMLSTTKAVILAGGTVIYSSNSGSTWTTATGGVNGSYDSISCTNTKCVALVPDNSSWQTTAYISTNSGQSWSAGQTMAFYAASIYCWQDECIAGNEHTNINTNPDKKTYKLPTISTSTAWVASANYSTASKVVSISCAGDNCIAIGYTGSKNSLLKSTNGGDSWTISTTNSVGSTNSIGSFSSADWSIICSGDNCFISKNTSTGGAGATQVIYTEDYGSSWSPPTQGYAMPAISSVALWYQ